MVENSPQILTSEEKVATTATTRCVIIKANQDSRVCGRHFDALPSSGITVLPWQQIFCC